MGSQTFDFNDGTPETWTRPEGVTEVLVKNIQSGAYGAVGSDTGGGGGSGSAAGAGADGTLTSGGTGVSSGYGGDLGQVGALPGGGGGGSSGAGAYGRVILEWDDEAGPSTFSPWFLDDDL